MDWPEIINRVERASFSSFSQCRHNSDILTLKNIIFALFPSSRPFIQNLIEQNLDVIDNHPERTLLVFNICTIVKENPKYYKCNYDFGNLWKSNDDASMLFRQIMQSEFQQLLLRKQLNGYSKEQINQLAIQRFRLLSIKQEIRQRYAPIEFQHYESIQQQSTPTKKVKLEQFGLDRQMLTMQSIKQKLHEHQLVIVLGPFASGKNFLVAQITSHKIEIQVDSTVDFESLMGTYVCSDQLGVFNYQDGPVLIALRKGYTLIIKNIQEASDDLLLQISKLQRSKSIEVQGTTLYAHKNFGIVGIYSYSPTESASYHAGNAQTLVKFQRYFRQDSFIHLTSYNKEEIISILGKCFPQVFQEPLTQMINTIVKDRLLTDYLKLVKRYNYHLKQYFGDSTIGKLYLVEELRKKLFLESNEITNDCESRYQIFGLQLDQLSQVTNLYNPEIQIYEKEIITNKLGIISREAFVKKQNGIMPSQIVYTQYSNQIIEKILTCIINNESCLLVGDTGCGKTTLSQHVASLFSKKLHVFNLSEGSDAQDLVGGFRPLDIQVQVKRVYQKFVKHFALAADMQKNSDFLTKIQELQNRNTAKSLRLLVKAMLQTTEKIKGNSQWDKIKLNLQKIEKQLHQDQKMSFHFLTGNLIKAMRKGDWVLIDEINLANNELLQKLIPAIEGKPLLFYERGDQQAIEVHPHFRIIGCMNPGSDVGKKELPANIKSKFTIHHIPEMTNMNDLVIFIRGIHSQVNAEVLANFYLNLKNQSQTTHYSLRNLSRALHYMKLYRLNPEVIYNGLALGFQGEYSDDFVKSIEEQFSIKVPRLKLTDLNHKFTETSVQIYGFNFERGPHQLLQPENVEFMVTDGNLQPLLTLLRAISGSGLPVLLEGPTSAGKTSLVNFVAQLIGQKCHRINNHQNTDIEEYIGQYTSVDGQIKFQEGLLVKALRDGDWVILDELNLARSEILEHLNRLLDDNQELFLAETQTVLKPHKRFRIFATQNPVTYAGRKMLSKAFRNRFIQIEVPDININDMDAIIKRRCIHVPPSHVQYMIQTYKEVNLYRSSEHLLMQRSGLITLRDLIKWGSRMQHSSPDNPKEALAMEGYCLLVEKLRDKNSIDQITSILEKIFNIKIDCTQYYETFVKENIIKQLPNLSIQWNSSFIKMAALTLKAVQNQEPVLLIGPAGVGKTTLASMLGQLLNIQSKTLVAHQYLEISDFVGALRPTRHGEVGVFQWQDGPLLECVKEGGIFLIDEINMCPESVLEGLNSVLEIPASLTVNERMYHPNKGFVILGAMNPSGDWGKKELTPALRSRFTEIYVQNPLSLSRNEIQLIMRNFFEEEIIIDKLSEIFFTYNNDFKYRMNINELTYRDLINIQHIVYKLINIFQLQVNQALIESLDINILIGLKNTIDPSFYDEISNFFHQIIQIELVEEKNFQIPCDTQTLGKYPFQVPFFKTTISQSFCFQTKSQNIQNLIKAITVDNKPILIQGPQSSGKMASIELLASLRSVDVIMIVLDEHTDLQELIGMDQPDGSKFKFKYGPLLQGIIEGKWIILKNLNLAPQNVLEGMNSIFDHRQEIFVPEVNKTYRIHQKCKIFGVQNPMSFGGGRKGLPASFLNRFVKVNYQDYNENDYQMIVNYSLQISYDIINQYHQKIYPCSLVAYIKFFKTLKLSQNELLTFNLCFGQNNQLSGNIFKKILTRDLSLVTDQRQQLLNLLLMQQIIQQSQIIGIYLSGIKSAGKKTLIQKLSQIYGKKIRYLKLSSTADSSDLIGKFEQLSQEGVERLRQSDIKQRRKTLLNDCNEVDDLAKVLQDNMHIETNQADSIFYWQESQLVKAIRNGDWLVIEDISYINPTLIPKLIPLLRCKRGEKIPLNTNDDLLMNPDFQLFITDSQIDNYNTNLTYLEDYCFNLKVGSNLNFKDKEQILNYQFQLLPLTRDIIAPIEKLSSLAEVNNYIREAQLQLFEYGGQTEVITDQQDIYHPFFIDVPVVKEGIGLKLDRYFTYLFKDLDSYQIRNLDDLFTFNYIIKSVEAQDVVQNSLDFIQHIIRNSYSKGQSREKELTAQSLEDYQEYYAKHYVKLPNLLKQQLEIFIQKFDANILLKASYIKQFFNDNLQLIFNLIGEANMLVQDQNPQDWLSKQIKQTMPKSKDQYYHQMILGCLTGTYIDTSNTYDVNGLCHNIQFSQIQKCSHKIIQSIKEDIQNGDHSLSLTLEQLRSFQKSISKLDQVQQKISIVSDNTYSNTSFMDGDILNILAHQVQERLADDDSKIEFTDIYRLLEYGKGSRQNLFELVLYLFKTNVNSIELRCYQQSKNERSISNLIYPQNVLFSDHLNQYELEINYHILRQQLGYVDITNLVLTLRNNLLTANISNLRSIIQIVDRVLKALSHDQYLDSQRIGRSIQQRCQDYLQIYGMEFSVINLYNLFLSAASIFEQQNNELDLFKKINKEQICSEQIKFQLYEIQQINMFKAKAYNFITFLELEEPDTSKQQELREQLNQYQQEIVLRGVSDDTFILTEQFIFENCSYIQKLREAFQHQEHFVSLAKQWMLWCHKKYFQNFKDILVPLFYPLILIIELLEPKVVQKPHTPANGFLPNLIRREPLDKINQLGKPIFFTDLQQSEDLLGRDKFKDYLLHELDALVKDEYTKPKEEPKAIDIKEYITAELNELEIYSNELLKYFLSEQRFYFLDQFLEDWNKHRSQMSYFLVLGEIYGQNDTEFNAILLRNMHHQILDLEIPQEINVFKQNSLILITQLNLYLRSLLEQINQFLGEDLFCENQMLIDLSINILNILEQPAFSSPIIKFTSMIEVLIDKIDQWDGCVPRSYHLKASCQEMIDLYIVFKQKEKSTWKFTLQKRITDLWNVEAIVGLKLYEQIQGIHNTQELQKCLWSFLTTCSLGVFEMRYLIVKRIEREVTNKDFKVVFEQVLYFANIFLELYNSHAQQSMKEFESEFKEEMNLISWKSVNYVLLKQASEKMQQRISKMMKRISGYLEGKFSSKIMDQVSEKLLINDFGAFTSSLHKYKAIKTLFLKPYLVPLKKMKVFQLSVRPRLKRDSSALWVVYEKSLQEYQARMMELKNTEAKSNIKQRTLEEFFKYAESVIGIKTTSKQAFLEGIDLSKGFINVSGQVQDQSLQHQINKSIGLYYNAIHHIRVTLSKNKMTQSIPPNLLKKGIAILFNIQQALYQTITTSLKITQSYSNATKIIDLSNYNNAYDQLHLLECVMNQLNGDQKNALKIKIQTIKSLKQSGKTDPKHWNELKNQLELLLNDLQVQQPQYDNYFEQSVTIKYLRQVYDSIPSMVEQEHGVYESSDKIKKEIKLLRVLMKKYQSGIVQSLDPEGDTTLMKTENKYLNTLSLFIKHYEHEQQPSQEYTDIIKLNVAVVVQNLRSSCKFLYFYTKVILNLYVNGFCSKEGEGKEQGGTDFKDGTGMGEGKGQENVTKDMEFEEQVLGEENQQKNKEEEEDDVDKDDKNEMEMDNNFDGDNSKPNEDSQPQEDQPEKDDLNDLTNSSVNDQEDQQQNNLDEEDNDQKKSQGEQDERNLDYEDGEKDLQAKENQDQGVSDKEQSQMDDENASEELNENEDKFSLPDNIENEEFDEDDNNEEEDQNDNNLEEEKDKKDIEEEQLEDRESQVSQPDEEVEQAQEIEEEKPEECEQENERMDAPQKNDDKTDDQNAGTGGDNPKEEGVKENKQNKNEQPNQMEEEEQEKQENTKEQNQGQDKGQDQNKAKEEKASQKDQEEPKKQNNAVQDIKNQTQMQEDDILEGNPNLEEQDIPQEETNNGKDANITENSQHVTKQATRFDQQNLRQKEQVDEQQQKKEKEQEKQQQQTQNQGGIEIEEDQNKNEDIQIEITQQSGNDKIEKILIEIDYQNIIEKMKEPKIEQEEVFDNREQWEKLQHQIHSHAAVLSEELKVVLTPQKCQALKGDYKTGKRLNMKKVIPFIASNYKKDKIWLRRTQPSKRTYQILIGLDNSLSMKENNVDNSAIQSLLSVALALQKMEVGQLGIWKIGHNSEVVKDFYQNQVDGRELMNQFNFSAEGDQMLDMVYICDYWKSILNFMVKSLDVFQQERSIRSNEQCDQLCFIISDGRLNKKVLHDLVKRAEQLSILYVFIIVDSKDKDKSIFNIKSTNYVMKNGVRKLQINRYMEDFPFNHYIVIKDFNELSKPLVNIIRQYFQLNNE